MGPKLKRISILNFMMMMMMMSWLICIAQSAESSDQEIIALDPPLER